MATQIKTLYIADDAITTAKIVDGAITAGKLDAGIVDGILAEKIVGKWVLAAQQSSPSATSFNVKTLLGFDSTAGVDPEGVSKGKAVLLEASSGVEFDTSGGKVGASAVARSSKCQIIDANGDAIVDSGGDEVWGVITASARTTGGTYTLRFFSGEFGSGSEATYTMSQAFSFTYPQIFDLSDMPQWSDERATLVDKDAAQLAAGQITATELASNAVTTVKITDANVTYAKIQDVTATNRLLGRATAGSGDVEEITVGGDLTQSGSTFTIANTAVSAAKLASDAVTTVKILDANVTQAKLASAVTARIGGGYDAIAAFTGDSSTTTFSFVHSDVHDTEEKMLVTVGGLVMERIDDYSISDGTGAAGVDQIVFVTAPPTGAHVIVRYRRTSI